MSHYAASTHYQAASGNSTITARHFLGVVAWGTGTVDVYKGSSATAANQVAGLTAEGDVFPTFPVSTDDQDGQIHVVCGAGVEAIVYYSE